MACSPSPAATRSSERRVPGAMGVLRPRRPVGHDRAQARLARRGLEQDLGAERGAEACDPLRVDVRPPGQPVDGGVDGRLRVVAEAVGVAGALAVAGVVVREHAVAVAGEHAHVCDQALAAAARTVAEQHGRAIAGRDVPGGQLAVRGLDRHLLMGDVERGLLDLPARGMRRHQRHHERHHGEQGEDGDGGEPAGAVGEPPAERAAAGRPPRGGDRGEAGGDEEQAAGDHADAGDVGPVRPGVDDVQTVRDDAEAERQQADDDAEHEPRRPGDVGLGQRPGSRDGDDREHPGQGRVGPENARSSRWSATSASPASSSGRSSRARRSRSPRCTGVRGVAAGGVARLVMHESLASMTRR